jgi:hypothetical protein
MFLLFQALFRAHFRPFGPRPVGHCWSYKISLCRTGYNPHSRTTGPSQSSIASSNGPSGGYRLSQLTPSRSASSLRRTTPPPPAQPAIQTDRRVSGLQRIPRPGRQHAALSTSLDWSDRPDRCDTTGTEGRPTEAEQRRFSRTGQAGSAPNQNVDLKSVLHEELGSATR